MKCVFVIPVYDDWSSVQRLVPEIAREAQSIATSTEVLLIDDGSLHAPPDGFATALGPAVHATILRLRRNLGHQRASAVGLCYVEAHVPCDYVVVMDGDGEDRPSDLPGLLITARDSDRPRVIFAERTRRSEGPLFFLMYTLYRAVHLVLTGIRVRVGNFSVVPHSLLRRLVSMSDLWNHYAAAVFKSRLGFATVPTTRGRRYEGRSRMNMVALVTHGLSAMAAFGDRIGVRLLAATVCTIAALGAAVFATAVLRLAGAIEIPAWAPLGFALAIVLLFQGFAISLAFVFIILAGRDSSTFVPLRDYSIYILDVQSLSARGGESALSR